MLQPVADRTPRYSPARWPRCSPACAGSRHPRTRTVRGHGSGPPPSCRRSPAPPLRTPAERPRPPRRAARERAAAANGARSCASARSGCGTSAGSRSRCTAATLPRGPARRALRRPDRPRGRIHELDALLTISSPLRRPRPCALRVRRAAARGHELLRDLRPAVRGRTTLAPSVRHRLPERPRSRRRQSPAGRSPAGERSAAAPRVAAGLCPAVASRSTRNRSTASSAGCGCPGTAPLRSRRPCRGRPLARCRSDWVWPALLALVVAAAGATAAIAAHAGGRRPTRRSRLATGGIRRPSPATTSLPTPPEPLRRDDGPPPDHAPPPPPARPRRLAARPRRLDDRAHRSRRAAAAARAPAKARRADEGPPRGRRDRLQPLRQPPPRLLRRLHGHLRVAGGGGEASRSAPRRPTRSPTRARSP